MLRTTIYLPEEVHNRLREKSFREKKSMSQIVVDLLNPEKKMEKLRAETPNGTYKSEPLTFVKKSGEIRSEDYV